MRYVHLAKLLFKDEKEYLTSVALNVKEVYSLIEKGWKYQTGEYATAARSSANPKIP
jgi:hypothetical protein